LYEANARSTKYGSNWASTRIFVSLTELATNPFWCSSYTFWQILMPRLIHSSLESWLSNPQEFAQSHCAIKIFKKLHWVVIVNRQSTERWRDIRVREEGRSRIHT
jgi:hypothetical protein